MPGGIPPHRARQPPAGQTTCCAELTDLHACGRRSPQFVQPPTMLNSSTPTTAVTDRPGTAGLSAKAGDRTTSRPRTSGG